MRPFFLRIVRKGKRNNNPTNTKSQATKQDKQTQRPRETKSRNQSGKPDKSRTKAEKERTKGMILRDYLTKEKAKHATPSKTAKHLTRTKAPQSTQNPQPTQIYICTPNPVKTPLKREIGHNIGLMQERKDSKGTKAGQKDGTHHERPPRATADPRSLPSGHHHRHPKRGGKKQPKNPRN